MPFLVVAGISQISHCLALLTGGFLGRRYRICVHGTHYGVAIQSWLFSRVSAPPSRSDSRYLWETGTQRFVELVGDDLRQLINGFGIILKASPRANATEDLFDLLRRHHIQLNFARDSSQECRIYQRGSI
jgi:hypothetical protein